MYDINCMTLRRSQPRRATSKIAKSQCSSGRSRRFQVQVTVGGPNAAARSSLRLSRESSSPESLAGGSRARW